VASKPSGIEGLLRERLRYFLSSSWRGRREVVATIDRLALLGDVVIFGGMLRDLLLFGNAGFDSDVDVVVVGADKGLLGEVLKPYGAQRNRFGGYRLLQRYWKLDVWHLEDTWAFRQGYVSPARPERLIFTTFFTWDAAAFSVATGRVWLHDNFEAHVSSRVLDINLLPNPNPEGAAIRAMRAVLRHQAGMSRAIADYVFRTISAGRPADLVERESASYTDPLLTVRLVSNFHDRLMKYLTDSSESELSPQPYQYSLRLPDAASNER
jgi:hypothetical protein